MTHLRAAAAVVALLVLAAFLFGYQAGLESGRHDRLDQLQRQVDQLTTDVSLLRE